MKSLYDCEVIDISGKPRKLTDFRGKVALVVNTASRCGFTPQYAELQNLYEKYRNRGFEVLAFPSNDFGGQEPGTDGEIAEFCETKFKVTFPVFSKAPVKGPEKQEAYKFLTEASEKQFHGDPGWNFVKFLVSKDGKVIGRFSSITKPQSKKLVEAIEAALA